MNLTIVQVVVDSINGDISCVCKKFTTLGMLCRHVLSIMLFLCYEKIPEVYIPHRWRKEATSLYLYVDRPDDDLARLPKDNLMLNAEVLYQVRTVVDHPTADKKLLESFLQHIKDFKLKYLPFEGSEQGVSTNNKDFFALSLGMAKPTSCNIKVPNIARNKGCGKRLQSQREIAIENSKRGNRTCGYCNEVGYHNSRTCPKKIADCTNKQSVSQLETSSKDSVPQPETSSCDMNLYL